MPVVSTALCRATGARGSADGVARTASEPDAARAHWWQSQDMKSTMQSTPLLISSLLRFGTTMHGDSEVVTWTRRRRPADQPTASSAGRPPSSRTRLRGLGITGDQRVGTFMWNNAEHLEAYLAVPVDGRGAAHPQHPALPRAARLRRDHADGSQVVIVDDSLAGPFAQLLPHLPDGQARHRHRARSTRRRAARSRRHAEGVHDLRRRSSRTSPTSFDWPEDLDERRRRRRCATPAARPATPRASSTRTARNYLHAMRRHAAALGHHARPTGSSPSCRCSTPTPGAALRRDDDRRVAGHARPVPAGRAAGHA